VTEKRPVGLIIGKFMPPHAGHLHLFAFAQQHVANLHIVLFSKSSEPIPGGLRETWLRELAPRAVIHHVTLEHAVDFSDPAAWDFWVSAIRDALPAAPDVVFSSETYGEELSRRLGAQHQSVDPFRTHFPIAATQIRARPLEHWDRIPPAVRPYFVRRVSIVGAESTGKTTLAQALAAHFRTVRVPEFAREYLLARDGQCTEADIPIIAAGQVRLEDQLAREANRLLVCDTDLLTTQLWHEHYFGPCPRDLLELSESRTAHLYLLCDLDVRWVADGLRDSPRQRQWFHRRFLEELGRRGAPVVLISGSRKVRLERAIAAAGALLETSA
jgi:NadR type nicotinamide-nucleotide adenylyltransferase